MGIASHAPKSGEPSEPCRRFLFSHLEEARHVVGQLLKPHEIRLRDRRSTYLNARMRHHRLNEISSSVLNYGVAVEFDADTLEDSFILLLPRRGVARIGNGSEHAILSPAVGACFSPRMTVHAAFDIDFEHRVVKIGRRLLEDQYALHLGESLGAPVEFDLEIDLLSQAGRHLSTIVDLMYRSSGLLSRPAGDTELTLQLQSVLLNALLYSLSNTHRARLLAEGAATSPAYVDRVAEFIAENAQAPLSIELLASHAAVSPRALFLGFQKYRKMTPMAYVRSVRLARVRAELLSNEAPDCNIKSVSQKWGFAHQSHFTAAYKAEFAELPSTTYRLRHARRLR